MYAHFKKVVVVLAPYPIFLILICIVGEEKGISDSQFHIKRKKMCAKKFNCLPKIHHPHQLRGHRHSLPQLHQPLLKAKKVRKMV